MKNVVVISSSIRGESSSRILAREVARGAQENNSVEFIDLKDFNLQFCRGCLACQKTKKCVINDDVKLVIDKIKNCDVIVFATPIYYYSISGQLKTFLDRLNPLFEDSYNFKQVYSVFTCADSEISAINGPRTSIMGWVECFTDCEYKGSFNGLNVTNSSDLTKELKNNAYLFGKSIK